MTPADATTQTVIEFELTSQVIHVFVITQGLTFGSRLL